MGEPDSPVESGPEHVLGQRIEALRESLGSIARKLSYKDLALRVSMEIGRTPPISASTMMKWAQGTGGSPDPWALVAMARLAGVSVEEFVYPPEAETADEQPRMARPIDPALVRPAPRSGDRARDAGEGGN